MSDRTIRDLLDANLALTREYTKLVETVIAAGLKQGHELPQIVTAPQVADRIATAPAPMFEMSTDDDWEDIPSNPEPNVERRLHLTEEEEDAAYSAANGLITPDQYNSLLEQAAKEAGLLNATVNND